MIWLWPLGLLVAVAWLWCYRLDVVPAWRERRQLRSISVARERRIVWAAPLTLTAPYQPGRPVAILTFDQVLTANEVGQLADEWRRAHTRGESVTHGSSLDFKEAG